ncbi:MAG: hypothetical protein OEZ14_01935 [Acidimicrobiia bacterium]|nr:hypothetical protein [Acidimicrobiia bacterium]MDH5519270.1 hypothetical protein [Acidimicrobiia bacterium]
MSNPLSDVERLAIHTSDGLGLRAELLDVGATADDPSGRGRPRAVAVVCHPHPLHGGNMYNHVVSGLFSTLATLGVPTIRFNFRGTSGSEGRHGGGRDERLDVIAAIETVTSRYERADRAAAAQQAAAGPVPVLLAGYSFGARVALSVDHPGISGWFAVAPPLAIGDTAPPPAARDPRPTVIVTGTADDFTAAADVERLTRDWEATTVIPLPGEDHFLASASARLSAEAEAVVDALSDY